MTDWAIVFRSLLARRFSSGVTVLTVALAVALMLVILSTRRAGREAFERGGGDMHILVSADASPLVSVLNAVYYANPPRRPLTWEKFVQLAASAPFEYAIPTQLGDSYRGMPVLATDRAFFEKFRPDGVRRWSFRQGGAFSKPFEVVVGAQAARASGLRVGSTIYVTHGMPSSRQFATGQAAHLHEHDDYAYTVVGVLDPSGTPHDRALFTDLTSAWILHAHDRRVHQDPSAGLTTEADLLESDRKITGVYLRLATREGSDVPANLPQVFSRLRSDPTITVAAPGDELRKLLTIIGSVDQILIAVAAAVMVSSGIAIMLALYNAMAGRRREIAVLRVLGCSRARVVGLVLTESALIGLAGAALGVLAALIGSASVAVLLKAELGLVVDPALPPRELVLVALATVTLAVVAGVAPAVLAYRTPVAKNLRPLA